MRSRVRLLLPTTGIVGACLFVGLPAADWWVDVARANSAFGSGSGISDTAGIDGSGAVVTLVGGVPLIDLGENGRLVCDDGDPDQDSFLDCATGDQWVFTLNNNIRYVLTAVSIDNRGTQGLYTSSTTITRAGTNFTTSHGMGAGDFGTGGDAEFDGVIHLDGIQADVGTTCSAGELLYDTGGATDELCYCQTTDTWTCWSATTTSGPTD